MRLKKRYWIIIVLLFGGLLALWWVQTPPPALQNSAISVSNDTALPHHAIPKELTNVNGTLFFTAQDRIHGRELWVSDGTDEGTMPVKDIWPNRPLPAGR